MKNEKEISNNVENTEIVSDNKKFKNALTFFIIATILLALNLALTIYNIYSFCTADGIELIGVILVLIFSWLGCLALAILSFIFMSISLKKFKNNGNKKMYIISLVCLILIPIITVSNFIPFI